MEMNISQDVSEPGPVIIVQATEAENCEKAKSISSKKSSSSSSSESDSEETEPTTKGQLISEWLFDFLNFPKNQRKNLMNFCPRI